MLGSGYIVEITDLYNFRPGRPQALRWGSQGQLDFESGISACQSLVNLVGLAKLSMVNIVRISQVQSNEFMCSSND